MLEKYALAAYIDPIGPHVLHDTFATRHLNTGLHDLRGLAAWVTPFAGVCFTPPGRERLAYGTASGVPEPPAEDRIS